MARDVHITGLMKLYKGRPSITIANQQQIKVLPRGSNNTEVTPDSGTAEQVKPIKPEDAVRFVDQSVVIEAVVADINLQERQAMIFFEGQKNDGFYLFVPSSAFVQLPSGFDAFYVGKRIRATGRVQLYKARPNIIITQSSQIRVIYDEPVNAENASDEKREAAQPPSEEPGK